MERFESLFADYGSCAVAGTVVKLMQPRLTGPASRMGSVLRSRGLRSGPAPATADTWEVRLACAVLTTSCGYFLLTSPNPLCKPLGGFYSQYSFSNL